MLLEWFTIKSKTTKIRRARVHEIAGLLRLTNRADDRAAGGETTAPKIQDREGIKHLRYAIAEKEKPDSRIAGAQQTCRRRSSSSIGSGRTQE